MARRRTSAGAGQSQRQLRVGEGLRHVLAELLLRGELHDPLLAEAHLTISEVRVTPDLRHAVVFVTELGGELRRRAAAGAGARGAAPARRGGAADAPQIRAGAELPGRSVVSRGGADREPCWLRSARTLARQQRGRRWVGLSARAGRSTAGYASTSPRA